VRNETEEQQIKTDGIIESLSKWRSPGRGGIDCRRIETRVNPGEGVQTSEKCKSIRKLYTNLPDTQVALTGALTTSRCSQLPLEFCKVLSDSARAFSGAPESTCSYGGAFRMLQHLTFRIVKFWSC